MLRSHRAANFVYSFVDLIRMAFATLPTRLRAAGIHLIISALVAGGASLLVFLVWYPPPFSWMAGGTRLFALLVLVDVVVGPTLTAVAASNRKPNSELVRDLTVIVALQACAFGYGMYSMALARPVALVFEVDLLRLISSADLEAGSLDKAPQSFRQLSWRGPKLIAVVKPTEPGELLRSVELALAGIPLAALPQYWREYSAHTEEAWHAALPVPSLLQKYPTATDAIAEMAARASQSPALLRFLPVQTRKEGWVAILAAPDARIVGYLPLDASI